MAIRSTGNYLNGISLCHVFWGWEKGSSIRSFSFSLFCPQCSSLIWDLSSQTRDQIWAVRVKAQSPNHQTTKGSSSNFIKSQVYVPLLRFEVLLLFTVIILEPLSKSYGLNELIVLLLSKMKNLNPLVSARFTP